MAYKFRIRTNTSGWIRNIQSVPPRIQSYIGYLYTKWLVKTNRVLTRFRSHDGIPKMLEKDAVKDLFYGGITELMNNKEFYYRSGVGADYSHWTEKGSIVLLEFVNSMTKQMHTAEERALDKRAKELVLKGLKGESV